MRVYFLISFSITLMFLSCKRDENTKDIIRDSTILVGESNNNLMIYSRELSDTLTVSYGLGSKFYIDMNHDGQNDILITACRIRSIDGSRDFSEIESLNNTKLLFFEKIDTVFYFVKYDTIYQNGYKEIFAITYYENIDRHDSSSFFSSTKRYNTPALSLNQVISQNDNWTYEKLNIFSFNYGGSSTDTTINNLSKVIYYRSSLWNFVSGDWPIGVICYIGVKCNNQLGWIKIKFISYSKMVIYGYGLQK